MESQYSFLTSPCTHVRVTLYSSLPYVPSIPSLPCHSFAMTINKSQGQSVKHVEIDLHTPVFTHGQLYVALPRATAKISSMFYFHKGKKGLRLRMLCIQKYYCNNIELL